MSFFCTDKLARRAQGELRASKTRQHQVQLALARNHSPWRVAHDSTTGPGAQSLALASCSGQQNLILGFLVKNSQISKFQHTNS